jgi:dienelactone hydrolase
MRDAKEGSIDENTLANIFAQSNAANTEIPRAEWIPFFNSFSRQHEGWLASIIVTHGDDEHTETQAYRLVGINADHAGSRHEIRVSVVRGEGAPLTHRVKHPINVTFRRDLKGAHEGLDIISADGARTRVRFRVAASPEMLDGLLPDMQHEAASRKPSVGHRQSLRPEIQEKEVHIPIDGIMLDASLVLPQAARGVVLFAHGSGSSRLSPRNRYVANVLQNAGFGALLMDLLTVKEEAFDQQTAALRFDIDLLARRLMDATRWLADPSQTAKLPIGYFGASAGAEAPDLISAVVARGGRPDLAGNALHKVIAPTLLIVGGRDTQVIALHQRALELIPAQKRLEIVRGATHLFEEPGALARVAELARDWFLGARWRKRERGVEGLQ